MSQRVRLSTPAAAERRAAFPSVTRFTSASSIASVTSITALAVLAIATLVTPTLATVPAPSPEELSPEAYDLWLQGGPRLLPMPAPLGPWNYVREFHQIVGFLDTWQVSDPQSPDYGGMIEAEAGPLGNIIQTDNTLEAIWCWSRYHQFSGRTTYDGNIAAAWIYCQAYPAWMEEGNPGDDYYRVHNCAWGLTAVLQYEAATGDLSFGPYAESCAQYIVTHPLVIDGSIYNQRLDAFVKGWAAGNLYLYGVARGNASYMSAAVTQGTDLRNWVDLNPSVNLATEYWAMSSGTIMWGLCNSIFLDNPGLGATWLAAKAPLMDIWQEWYDVPGYDWDSSWNVAYGNAHFAVWDRLGDDRYRRHGVLITDLLLSLDTDDDGGIVSNTHEPVTEDMSWVTSYLCKFGVDRLMGTPPAHDVGILRFAGVDDGDWIIVGTPILVAPVATNYGLSDELGVDVHLEGDAGTGTDVANLPFGEQGPVAFVPAWSPPTGTYTLTAYTVMAGDLNPSNDSTTITIHVYDGVAVADGSPLAGVGLRVLQNPFRTKTGFVFDLDTASTNPPRVGRLGVHGATGAPGLDIFDLGGHLVRRFAVSVAGGEQRIVWDGSDRRGASVAPGVYLYRLDTGRISVQGKVVRTR